MLDAVFGGIHHQLTHLGRLVGSGDAKLNFDDNALYRHKDMMELHDETEEDPAELEAGLRGQGLNA